MLSGVIEGFYGRPWSQAQRVQLLDNMRKWGMNVFMYAPKDDKKHRAAWRNLYEGAEIEKLSALIQKCNENGISFVYAVAPGLDIRYSEEKELEYLRKKVSQVASLGCSHFAVLWDDISANMDESDKSRFQSFASAQCYVSNEVASFLRKTVGDHVGIFFCPTEYCGRLSKPSVAESAYLRTIGDQLDLGIDFFWTGPDIISLDIPVESIEELRSVIKRKPTIWDNLHANDYDMRRYLLGGCSDWSGCTWGRTMPGQSSFVIM